MHLELKRALLVALGGAIGSVGRHAVARFFEYERMNRWVFLIPIHTLLVNVLGCFIIGYWFYSPYSKQHFLGMETHLLISTGVLGGFTTFSAFSRETMQMFQEGLILKGVFYVLASVGLGLGATGLGMLLAKSA